jgi:WD40 repeat protein
MELVKGVPINQFCDNNRLTTRERLELFKQVCQAVHHAHQKGIIHRDLKPSNVLVALYDDKPVPKVIDFGVAKATNQQLTEKTLFTEVGSILGTWEYMSPEQAVLNQLDVDVRTDVYSLGVLLYELLTGETPLDRKRLREAQIMDTLRMIREDEPPKPSTRVSSLGEKASTMAAYRRSKPESLASEIRGDLDWIVMKALAKERSRRYDSASRFAEDVASFLTNQLVEARPPSTCYRIQRFYQRNSALMLSAGAVFVALSIGLLVALLALRGTRLTNASLEERQQQLEETQVKLQRSIDAESLARTNAVEARNDANRRRMQAEEELYFADMRAASHLLQVANFPELRQLLARHASSKEGVDYRHVEYDYLARMTHRWDDAERIIHGTYVFDMALSPDGKILATVDTEGRVKLWDTENHEQLDYLETATTDDDGLFPKHVALAVSNGHLVIAHAGIDSRQVLTVDVDSKGQISALEHDEAVWQSAFSHDGRYLATVTNSVCTLWDLETKQPESIGDLDAAVSRFVAVAFSPTSYLVAFSDVNGKVYVHDVEQDTTKTLNGHAGPVSQLAFSPSGNTLAVGSSTGSIDLWDLPTYQRRSLAGHPEPVRALVISPDGQQLFSAGRERILRVWDIQSSRLQYTIAAHSAITNDLVFSADGQKLFAGDSAGRVCVFRKTDLSSHRDSFDLGVSSRLAPDSCALSHDGKYLAVCPNSRFHQGRLEIWDLESYEKIDLAEIAGENIAKVDISNKDQLLTLGEDNCLNLWDLQTRDRVLEFQPPANAKVACFAFSQDGEWLIIGDEAGEVSLYRIGQPRAFEKFSIHGNQAIGCVGMSLTNNLIAAVDMNGELKVLDRSTGSVIREASLGQTPFFYRDVCFSPDPATPSKLAVVWGGLRVWDLANELQPRRITARGFNPSGVGFTADGKSVLTPTVKGLLHIWDAATLRERIVFRRHVKSVDHFDSVNHEGTTTLATVGRDGRVCLWELAAPRSTSADTRQ